MKNNCPICFQTKIAVMNNTIIIILTFGNFGLKVMAYHILKKFMLFSQIVVIVTFIGLPNCYSYYILGVGQVWAWLG